MYYVMFKWKKEYMIMKKINKAEEFLDLFLVNCNKYLEDIRKI